MLDFIFFMPFVSKTKTKLIVLAAVRQKHATLQLAELLGQSVVFTIETLCLRFQCFLVLALANQFGAQCVQLRAQFVNL